MAPESSAPVAGTETMPRKPTVSKPMKAADFARLIEELGLSQLAVGRFLDYDGRQVRRWVAGERPVPVVVEILLTYMLVKDLTPAEVLAACEIVRPPLDPV